MPENIVSLKVLLSSPLDLKKERESFKDLILDVNRYLERVCYIRFETLSLESHTYPSVGSDAQDVINKELPNYDVYIGIIGKRIGSETPRTESGTIEEYQRAYEDYLSEPQSKKILFYFKIEKIPSDKINTKEISKVNDFRKQLEENGVYYWKYKTIFEFRMNLHFHLYSHAIDYYFKLDLDVKEDSYEYLQECIEEGNKYMDLVNECILMMYDELINGEKELNNVGKSFNSAKKRNDYQLMQFAVKQFIKHLKELNKKVNFYNETLLVCYEIVIDDFTKGIIGFKIGGVLGDLISATEFLLSKLYEVTNIIRNILNQFEEIIEFDRIFGTTIIKDTKELYYKINNIFFILINNTEEFLDLCNKVNRECN